jgi:hypothetical protein
MNIVRRPELLWCGVIAGPLFTLAYLVEGAIRPDYDPLRHPVSSLALTDRGWTQTLNFLVAGVLTLAFAFALAIAARRARWGPLFVGGWGAGLVFAGLFITDPIGGYPPGTPLWQPNPTTSGALHDNLSLAGFVAITAACLAYARTGPRWWRRYSAISGVAFLAIMTLSSVAFGQPDGDIGAFAGLFQRLAVTVGWTWQTLLAVRLLQARPRGVPEP